MFSQYWVTLPPKESNQESKQSDLPPIVSTLTREIKNGKDLGLFLQNAENKTSLQNSVLTLTNQFSTKLQTLWKPEDRELKKIQTELRALTIKFDYDGKEDTTNEHYLVSYKEGLPLFFYILNLLDSDSISKDLIKNTMLSLFEGMNLCFPGIHTRAVYAWMQLTAITPQQQLMLIRQEMAKNVSLMRIREHEISQEEGMVGNEIHLVNSIINYLSLHFGLLKVNDSFALDLSKENPYPTSYNAHSWYIALTEIAHEMQLLLTNKSVFELLAEKITGEIKTFKNDSESSDKIINLLNGYGPDEDYQVAYHAMTETGSLQVEWELHQNTRLTLFKRCIAKGYIDNSLEKQILLTPTLTLHVLPDPSFHFVRQAPSLGSPTKILPLSNYLFQKAEGYSIPVLQYDTLNELQEDVGKNYVSLPALAKIGNEVSLYGKTRGSSDLAELKCDLHFVNEALWTQDSTILPNECYQIITEQDASDELAPLELLDRINKLLFPKTVLSLFTADALSLLPKNAWNNITLSLMDNTLLDSQKIIELFFDKNALKSPKKDKSFYNLALSCGQVEAINKILNKAKSQFINDDWKVHCCQWGAKETALHIAINQGDTEIVDCLLTHLPYDQRLEYLRQVNPEGYNALFLAIRKNNEAIVKSLLTHLKPEDRLTYKQQIIKNANALFLAIRENNAVLVQLLLSNLNYEERLTYQTEIINETTALTIAAKKGQLNIVELLLNGLKYEDKVACQKHVEPKWATPPLYSAAKKGQVKVVELLLQTLTYEDKISCLKAELASTPLGIAVEKNHFEVVELFLKNLNYQDRLAITKQLIPYLGATPLYIAAEKGHIKIVELLLTGLNYADSLEYLKQESSYGLTPLCVAAQKNEISVVDRLLLGLNKEHKLAYLRQGKNSVPLFYIVLEGHLEVLELLLKDLTHTERYEYITQDLGRVGNSLFVAAKFGHLSVVRELLKGLSYNERLPYQTRMCDGRNSLFAALEYRHDHIVNELLQGLHYEDRLVYQKQANTDGETSLFTAAEYGCFKGVNDLLQGLHYEDRLAQQKQTNLNKKTPLFVAARSGHLKVVKELLQGLHYEDRLACQKQTNLNEETPLFVAARFGYFKVVNELLQGLHYEDRLVYQKQANLNGETPLFIAALFGYFKVVKRLLQGLNYEDRLAYLNQVNTSIKETPLHAATKNGHLKIAKLLLRGLNSGDILDYSKQVTSMGGTALHNAASLKD